MFGETDYDPVRQFNPVSFDEQLDALRRAVDAGKVGNHIILSSSHNSNHLYTETNIK